MSNDDFALDAALTDSGAPPQKKRRRAKQLYEAQESDLVDWLKNIPCFGLLRPSSPPLVHNYQDYP